MSDHQEQPPRFHRVLWLEVTGGFLHGQRIEFDDQLTCVIGHCGAGKTAVLEFVRFALHGLPSGGRTDELKERLEKTLGRGQVTVGIETADGVRYTVARTLSGKPEVRDAQGNPVRYDPMRAQLFDVDIYRAVELQDTAADQLLQRALLDRFDARAIREVQDEVARLVRLLEARAQEATNLEHEVEELEKGLEELAGLRTELAALPSIEGEDRDEIEQEVARRGLHERREGAFTHLTEALEETRVLLCERALPLTRLEELVPQELRQGPDGAALRAAWEALLGQRQRLEQSLGALRADLEQTAMDLRGAAAEQQRLSHEQEERYAALFARHKAQKGLADERCARQRRLTQLEERSRQARERRADQARVAAERERLLDELRQARRRRYELRRAVALRLNDQLAGSLTIKVEPRADRGPFTRAILQALGEKRGTYQDLVPQLAKLAPSDLARMIKHAPGSESTGIPEDAEEELRRHLRLERATRVRGLLQALRQGDALRALETAEEDDLPTIRLRLQQGSKELQHLSQGQRGIALLLLLLLENERPLLIDEPERSLDQELVVDTLLQRLLHDVARRRQVVVATHNPNLPVLGNGKVVALAADADHGRVLAEGGVDQTGPHAERILEGGRPAFEERRRRYRDAAPDPHD